MKTQRLLIAFLLLTSLAFSQTHTGGGGRGGGGASTLDTVGNPAASKNFDMGSANILTFHFSANSSTNNLMSLTDFANNTGTGYLASLTTASGSAMNGISLARGATGTGTRAFSITDNSLEKAYCTFAGVCVFAGSVSTGATPPTACGSATACTGFTEAATPGTPTAAQDYIRASSINHQFYGSFNNSAESAVSIVQGSYRGQVPMYNNAAGFSAAAVMPRPSGRKVIRCAPSNATTGICDTDSPPAFSNTPVQTAADANNGVTLAESTTAVANNVAVIKTGSGGGTAASAAFRTGRNLYKEQYFAPQQSAHVIYWAAVFTDQTAAVQGALMYNQTSTSANYAGFGYCSDAALTGCGGGAGSANWQCVTHTGASNTVVDSGIAIDATAGHWFQVWEESTSGTVNAWHFGIDGTELTACKSTTNMPTTGTNLIWLGTADTLEAVIKTFRWGGTYTEQDK